MKIPKMINNHVLIKVPKRTQIGGIAMPREYTEVNIASAGTVAAIGPKCEYVKVGDFVYYKNMVGHRIEDDSLPDDFHFIVVAEADLIGYFSKKEEVEKIIN